MLRSDGFYQLGSARYYLVEKDEYSSIYRVALLPCTDPGPDEFMVHDWLLTLVGSQGEPEVWVRDEWHLLPLNREFLVPARTRHAFRNRRDVPAQLYLIARPGGFPEFLEKRGIHVPLDHAMRAQEPYLHPSGGLQRKDTDKSQQVEPL
jgi:hypothetical protein